MDSSPRFTIDQVRAFCAVADEGSYQKAAKALDMDTRVSVIRLVERFTKTLGDDKLVRQQHGKTVLTETGRQVLPTARGLLELAEEMAKVRPEIRFSAYPTIAGQMAIACPHLLEQDIPLVLRNISEANRQDGGWKLADDVANGALDMAIAPAGLSRPGLEPHPLYKWHLCVVLPDRPNFGRSAEQRELRDRIEELRELKRIRPDDLDGLRIAAAPIGHKSRALLHEAFRKAGRPLAVAVESPNHELLKAVAEGGTRYVAVIPDDAFSAESTAKALGRAPRLAVEKDDSADEYEYFGGEYTLYTRPSEQIDGEPSEVETAIAAAADDMVEAFNERYDKLHPRPSPAD